MSQKKLHSAVVKKGSADAASLVKSIAALENLESVEQCRELADKLREVIERRDFLKAKLVEYTAGYEAIKKDFSPPIAALNKAEKAARNSMGEFLTTADDTRAVLIQEGFVEQAENFCVDKLSDTIGMTRTKKVVVPDVAELSEEYLMLVPDMDKIEAALEEGKDVPGVHVETVIRPRLI